MKVLVIGGGGREHAIVRALLISSRRPEVFCAPGNAGIALPVGGRAAKNVDIAASDIDSLLEFARTESMDLTVVGPEEPLCAGVVDRFRSAGLRIFGPTASAARIEGDKAFAKRLMQQSGVPTADARIFEPTDAERRWLAQRAEPMDVQVFRTFEKAQEYILRRSRPLFVRAAGRRDLLFDCRDEQDAVRAVELLMVQRLHGDVGGAVQIEEHPLRGFDRAREYILTRDEPLVVKAAGLARGKGVFLCNEPSEALRVAEQLMVERTLGEAGASIVVEERLAGREVSLLALVAGRTIYLLEPARDYKRLRDDDTGPNTGGMGAYSSSDLLADDILAQVERSVFVPVIDALLREEAAYTGILYAGLMLTPGGPKVLEFNCRFGDPETQPTLMRLQTDLLDVMNAAVDDQLDQVTLAWDPRPAACVVMASEGYPDKPALNRRIHGLDHVNGEQDRFVFHSGTRAVDDAVLTSGGRVLSVTALGGDLAEARDRAYELVTRIRFEGAQYRRDIAITGAER